MFTIFCRLKTARRRNVSTHTIHSTTTILRATSFPMVHFQRFWHREFALDGWNVHQEFSKLFFTREFWNLEERSTITHLESSAVCWNWAWLKSSWRNVWKLTRLNATLCVKPSTPSCRPFASSLNLKVVTLYGSNFLKTVTVMLWAHIAWRISKFLPSEEVDFRSRTNSRTSFAWRLHFIHLNFWEKELRDCAMASTTSSLQIIENWNKLNSSCL